MNSAMTYEGDKLDLYVGLRELCCSPDDDDSAAAAARMTTAAVELTAYTGPNCRWLPEWMAYRAAMGVLLLMAPKEEGNGNDDNNLEYRSPSRWVRPSRI